MPPRLIVFAGAPGVGKTTLSEHLARATGLRVIHRDDFKRASRGAGDAPIDNAAATDAFFRTVFAELSAGISCIVDAAFQHAVWEARLAPIAGTADLRFVVCEAPVAVRRSRRLGRASANPAWLVAHPDPGVAGFRETGAWPGEAPFVPPSLAVPTLAVSTLGAPEEVVERILTWLGGVETMPPS
ncbi:MAG: AAA family ATPase [Armatimonadota bacterium]